MTYIYQKEMFLKYRGKIAVFVKTFIWYESSLISIILLYSASSLSFWTFTLLWFCNICLFCLWILLKYLFLAMPMFFISIFGLLIYNDDKYIKLWILLSKYSLKFVSSIQWNNWTLFSYINSLRFESFSYCTLSILN